MRLPRDLSGKALIEGLKVFGYQSTRQTGSHVRLTTHQRGEHDVTIPVHASLRLGTLSGVLNSVALHFDITRDEVLRKITR